MAWQNITVVPNNPAFASQFNAVQANITAQANGDSGAPKNQTASYATNSVGQAAIANGGVGQAQLKIGVSTVSLTKNPPSSGTISQQFVSPGGFYDLSYALTSGSATASEPNASASMSRISSTGNYSGGGLNISANRYEISIDDGGSSSLTFTATGQIYYVTASPPYNLGHGDIATFVFLKADIDGNIISTYVSETPPWAYNGKTDIRPDLVESDGLGGLIKKKLIVIGECPAHPTEGGCPHAYSEFIKNSKREYVEIDHAMKNADMNEIPHPFMNFSDTERVILIDPTSEIADQLSALHESGENIGYLISSGYIEIGDEIKNCNKPNGVHVHSANWKVA